VKSRMNFPRPVVSAILIFIAAALFPILSATPSSKAIDAVLDPTFGLKELADTAGSDGVIPTDRFFLVTGRIGVMIDRTSDEEGAEFQGENELVGGEWTGLASVRSYRVYLRFMGDRFAPIMDDESPEYIEKGTLVVVIGSYAGKVKEYGTEKMTAVLDVLRIIAVK
jgi:hypothetical protein